MSYYDDDEDWKTRSPYARYPPKAKIPQEPQRLEMPASINPADQIKEIMSDPEYIREITNVFKKAAVGYRDVLLRPHPGRGRSDESREYARSQRIGEWVTQLRRALNGSNLLVSPNSYYPRTDAKYLFRALVDVNTWSDALELKTSHFYSHDSLIQGVKQIMKNVTQELKDQNFQTDDEMSALNQAVQEMNNLMGQLGLVVKGMTELNTEADKKVSNL